MSLYNPLDAALIIVSIIGGICAILGFVLARDGQMAFARPIRDRIVYRRFIHMATYIVVFAMIGWAVRYDMPYGVVLCLVGVVIGAQAVYEVVGWVDFQRVLGDIPLTTDESTDVQLSLDTRPIVHEINNLTAIVVGNLILHKERTVMPVPEQYAVQSITEDMARLCELIHDLQVLVQAPTKPPEGVQE